MPRKETLVLDFTLVHSTEFALRGSGHSLVSIGREGTRLYGRAEQLRILKRVQRENRPSRSKASEPELLKGEPPCIA